MVVTSMILVVTQSIIDIGDVGGDVAEDVVDGVDAEDQKTRQFDTPKVLVVTQTVSGIISPMSVMVLMLVGML